MIELEHEMTYEETIAGPLGSTGVGLMRVGPDGLRRPDLHAQLLTDDGELVLFR
jgi:hypothetical protein